MMKRPSVLGVVVLAAMLAWPAWSTIPRTISYQGVLTDSNGDIVADGSYNMTFRLYDAATNGTLLWEEAQSVAVATGRFDVILGKTTSLDALGFDADYWLALVVEGDPEMTPRTELTASAFSLNSRTVEDSAVTGAKIAAGTVVRSINSIADHVVIAAGSNVMIAESNDSLVISSAPPDTSWVVVGNDMYTPVAGNIGIGTATPTSRLDVRGTTKTEVLEITGGADLAEPFPVADAALIPEGALVVIDDEHPGRLELSDRPYDRRVAGVVSGAGGVRPGLTLSQPGLENGRYVALSGRVYVLADASSAPIRPGDLLTTSASPGHAMRASDAARSHGAIVGKAMSSLDSGKGLVLVLVNLH